MEATGDDVAVRWLTAFVDRPAATFDAAVGFWTAVTATTRSPWRGDRAQFATLVPTGGDAHLRVQRVLAGPGGTHVDLHVDDPVVAAARARALGATGGDPLALRSPAGLPFCLVHHCDERTLPAAAQSPGGVRTLADQVCIDVAPERSTPRASSGRR